MEDLKNKIILEMEADGNIIRLTQDEAVLVRKVLQCANTLYTCMEHEYSENKIDPLIRKLRRAEHGNTAKDTCENDSGVAERGE